MSPAHASGQVGGPPLTIGVTGHRKLAQEDPIAARVTEAISSIRERFAPDAGVLPPLRVVSSLAEGTDRIVAREVLRIEGSSLEVVLPFDRDEYARDFSSPASAAEFDDLMTRATTVRRMRERSSRDEAYEAAGRAVVDRSDAMIIVWDGEPSRGRGGTAETLRYAHEHRVPLRWIESSPPFSVHDEQLPPAPSPARTRRVQEDLAAYENELLDRSAVEAQKGRQRELWSPVDDSDLTGFDPGSLIDWSLEAFPRADLLATKYQRRHELTSLAVFVLPIVAVVAVTMQLFAEHLLSLAIVEVAAFLLILAGLLLSRRTRYHARWISYRYLAERLRSAYFLAVAGTGDQLGRPEAGSWLSYTSDDEDWIKELLEQHARAKPADLAPAQVESVRTYLARYWIEDQAAYFCRASRRHARLERVLASATLILFSGVLVLGILHTLLVQFGETTKSGRSWQESLVIALSIVLPVVGAAVHGIRSAYEYKRHSERYRRMVELLRGLRREIYGAEDLDAVRAVARDVERLTRDENSDWFGVTRFHDVELIL